MTVTKDQLLEALQRRQHRIESGDVIQGHVTVAGKGVLHWQDPRTVTAPGSTQLRHSVFMEDVNWGTTPIKKRSWQQRVESLTRRLIGAAQQAERMGEQNLSKAFFEALAGELWKQGHPVTVQMLEEKAKEILRYQDRKQGLSLVQEVGTGAVSAPGVGAKTPNRAGW